LPHCWIDQHGNALAPGQQLVQQCQSLRDKPGQKEVKARDVSGRLMEARYQTHLNGVPTTHEYDRDALRRALSGERCGWPGGEDHRDLTPDKLSGKLRQRDPAVGRLVLNRRVLSLEKALHP
jgi:hypothetical protein